MPVCSLRAYTFLRSYNLRGHCFLLLFRQPLKNNFFYIRKLFYIYLVSFSLDSKQINGQGFKAALLSGPPGVGKTTTAQVVCKELGYDLLEFNASDTRNKTLLKEEISGMLSNTTMKDYFTGKHIIKIL